jgi:predicted PurR-regulated permease PerM
MVVLRMWQNNSLIRIYLVFKLTLQLEHLNVVCIVRVCMSVVVVVVAAVLVVLVVLVVCVVCEQLNTVVVYVHHMRQGVHRVPTHLS